MSGDVTFTDPANQPAGNTGEVIDARAFGVTSAGGYFGTDQGPAIQRAIDSIPGGGVVQLPMGGMNLRTPLSIKQNVWLVGHGVGITGLYPTNWPSTTAPFITYTGCVGGIKDLAIFGNSGPTNGPAVFINNNAAFVGTGGSYTNVERLLLYCNSQSGIYLNGLESRLINCYVRCNGTTGAGYELHGSDNFVWGCTADTCHQTGFNVQTSNTKFTACKAFGCTSKGWQIGAGFRNMFSSCEAQDCGDVGFSSTGGGGNVFAACVADTNANIGFWLKGYDTATGCLAINRQQVGGVFPQTFGFRGSVSDTGGYTPTISGTSYQPAQADVDPASVGYITVNGRVYGLPTSDPQVRGAMYSNGGVLTLSK